MNQKKILLLFLKVFIPTLFIGGLFVSIFISKLNNDLNKRFDENKRTELTYIMKISQNNILNNDFRTMRNHLSPLQESGVFLNYKILDIQNNILEEFTSEAKPALNTKTLNIPIYFPSSSTKYGQIIFEIESNLQILTINTVVSYILKFVFLIVFSILLGFIFFYLLLNHTTQQFIVGLNDIKRNFYGPIKDVGNPWYPTLVEFKNLLIESEEKNKNISALEKNATIIDLSKQVSHDIRSPLAALNMVIGDLDQVADDKRILIRNSVNRINDIANTLLTKSKNTDNELAQEVQMTTELIPSLIDSIVSEKRIQYRDKTGINIEADLLNSYGAFALINAADLKRVISNLINNSVEASKTDHVTVIVTVNNHDNIIKIIIKDNGKGIPAAILSQLGLTTISFGKEKDENNSGSGLGIFHAKKSIENSHGEMNIESAEGIGTTISISFPRASTPEWFVEKVIVHKKQTIVILDDDVTIHQAWQGRFDQLVELVKFSSVSEFESWFNSQKNKATKELLFLFDYDLGKLSETGLDLIEKHHLQSQSILVTSRYEEPIIKIRADRLKLKIIPKGMIGLVAIEITSCEIEQINDLYTRCLIDDDPLVRMTWEWAAKKDNIKLLTCNSAKSFQEQISKVNFETEIYIDIHLAEDVKGQEVAASLHDQGFKKLYFATGYEASAITDVPEYILGITGKNPVRNN